jgi:hypothetical protein
VRMPVLIPAGQIPLGLELDLPSEGERDLA